MISSSDRTAEICLASSLDEHLAVRHQVFVVQQKLFDQTDVDTWDSSNDTLHAVAVVDGSVVGTVRLYPLGSGLWKGDRLAVLPSARVHRLGAALVDFAVATAGALGGERMVAQVQMSNVRFFQRLGWSVDGEPGSYHGALHQPMAIDLGR